MTAQQMVSEILQYVGVDAFANWYVGIAHDPRQRLFTEHAVDEVADRWIFRRGFSSEHARAAETYLLNQGFDGGSGGGDLTTMHLYAYRKTPTTVE